MDTTLPAPTSTRRGAARIAAGVTVGVIGLLLLAAGIAGIVARTSSDGGYVSTGTHQYASSGHAIVTDAMHIGAFPDWLVARLRVRASSDKPLFVGVGRRADVDRYLAGVAHSTIEDVSYGPFDVSYSTQPGSAIPARPVRTAVLGRVEHRHRPSDRRVEGAERLMARRRDERRRLPGRRHRCEGRRNRPRRARARDRRACTRPGTRRRRSRGRQARTLS